MSRRPTLWEGPWYMFVTVCDRRMEGYKFLKTRVPYFVDSPLGYNTILHKRRLSHRLWYPILKIYLFLRLCFIHLVPNRLSIYQKNYFQQTNFSVNISITIGVSDFGTITYRLINYIVYTCMYLRLFNNRDYRP